MRFLLTNDDGIDSVFLHELVHALKRADHDLYVVAPKKEQSWVGAAKSRNRPVHATTGDRGFGCPTWIVDGTPSDAVNIALDHLLPPGSRPEAVISGINVGLNASLGFIIASGTIAGAWEGALHGLPAIAFSQDLTVETYDRMKEHGGQPDNELLRALAVSAARAAEMVPDLVRSTEPRSFTVHNINFPFPHVRRPAVKRTVPAQVVVPRLFSPAADDGTHRLIFRNGEDLSPSEPLTDRSALAAGHISHTLLDYRTLGRF